MTTAVCCIPISPLRKEPSHKSEMVSQLLFGEYCEVLEQGNEQWLRISGQYDDYEGWCRGDQLTAIEPMFLDKADNKLVPEWVTPLEYNGYPMRVPFGSSLAGLEKGEISWGSNRVYYDGEPWEPKEHSLDEATLTDLAKMFLNTPYLWGGKSIFGIDCSGYTQTVYKYIGIHLLRDANQQAMQGETLGFLEECRCGDLAFFDNPEGKIVHVGILLNDREIIHASGKVRIDRIDNLGIIHPDHVQRTHRLRLLKRYPSAC